MARPLLALALALVGAFASSPARAQGAPAAATREDAGALERRLVDLAEHGRARTALVFGVIGLGSGAVVDARGWVVTNAHVVAGARYALVQWADGTTALCRQRGIDYVRDLAVLEPVEPEAGRPAFSLAPAAPGPGAWVVALGFPGGRKTDPQATVSVGRVLPGAGGAEGPGGLVLDYGAALRHDAPIFSGNSGGPLVDLEGRLVGINGAVDLERGVSLTIPVDVVAERLEALQGGLVVLPGGRAVRTGDSWALRALYRLLDPLARALPERVAEGTRSLLEQEERLPEGLRERAAGAVADVAAAERLAQLAQKSPRQQALDEALWGPGGARGQGARAGGVAVDLADGRVATRVGPRHAVAKASALPPGDEVALAGGGRARRVATSEPDDLALLELPPGQAGVPGSGEDAPHRAPGALVEVRAGAGAGAWVSRGVVAATPRRASARLAASVAQGGVPGPVVRAVEALGKLADRLGSEELRALVEQLEGALEGRRAFASGTPPRGYALVLSVDAPVRPSHMGAPVTDRDGRLVGVAVGVPHFGTTLVVPAARVREVFAAHLGGGSVPERLGPARLY